MTNCSNVNFYDMILQFCNMLPLGKLSTMYMGLFYTSVYRSTNISNELQFEKETVQDYKQPRTCRFTHPCYLPGPYRTLRVQLPTYSATPMPRMVAFKGSVVGLELEMEQNKRRHKIVAKTEHTRGPWNFSREMSDIF